jgi:transglutaminase-like putative cysteine protease
MSRLLAAISLSLVAMLASQPVGAEGFDRWSDTAHYEFEYRVDLGSIESSEGQSGRLWLPMPANTRDQQVLSVVVESPLPHREQRDALGNRVAYIDWEGKAPQGEVVFRYTIKRMPSSGIPMDAISAPYDEPARYLQPTRKIPLDGVIAQLGAQEAQGQSSDAAKIRAFYDYVYTNMRYAKNGTGWGQGDAIWACTEKYGNCTDFHSLFMGMARSQGIPARFAIGFPIPHDRTEAEIGGYHCWAEAWDPARGWVPMDASEAWKSQQADAYFGKLPSDRIVFTIGRDLVLNPEQQGDPLNYFIYPYAEVSGRPVEGIETSFRFRRVEGPVTAQTGAPKTKAGGLPLPGDTPAS